MARDNVKYIPVDNNMLNPDDANDFYATDMAVLDVRNGGQWGVLPRIGGVENDAPIHEWMHNQKYQRRDVMAIVLETPRGFDLLPNGENFKQALKAMIEVHAKTIDGLNSSLTVEKVESDMGISGGKFAEVVNVTRESSNVSITVEEVDGNPFEVLLDVWIRYILEDPDLKAPLITRILAADAVPKSWSTDYQTCTVLFIEPDALYRKAIHAWLVCNMFPNGNPDIIGKKDKNASREFKTISLELGGFAIPHTNRRVKKLATTVLNNLELWSKDPEDMLLPSDKVDASLANVNDVDIYYDGVKPGTGGNADGNSVSATAE